MLTRNLFDSIFPTTGLTSARNLRRFNLVRERDKLIDALNRILPKYKIDNHDRLTAFLGNCGVETDFFRTTSEYADGWDYDISVNPKKARALGNFNVGDGPKYKGSGLSQTTGGNNFKAVQKAIGKLLGVDVVKNPELLRQNIDIAVESACIFWKDNNLNSYADRGEFKQLSAIVNRGDKTLEPLHWSKRNALYMQCRGIIPKNFAFALPPPQLPIISPQTSVQNTQPVVLTPTGAGTNPPIEGEQPSVVAAPPVPESSVKKFLNKYILHCPTDSAKNVLLVVSARIGGWAVFLWNLGLHGKVLLFLIAFGAIVPLVWAFVKYKSRIWEWIESVAENFLQE